MQKLTVVAFAAVREFMIGGCDTINCRPQAAAQSANDSFALRQSHLDSEPPLPERLAEYFNSPIFAKTHKLDGRCSGENGQLSYF